MGWFGKKKKTIRRRRNPWSTIVATVDLERLAIGMKVVATIVAVAALAGAWHFGESYLGRYAARLGQQTGLQIDLITPPTWMNSRLRQQIVAVVAQQIDAEPMDGTDLHGAINALEQLSWIRRVRRIERLAPDHVQVLADYRQPAALVATSKGDHLVDDQGVRLLASPYDRTEPARPKLPLIMGLQDRPAQVGKPWPGQDIAAALRLINLLATRPYFDQVQAIDLSSRDSRGRVRLLIKAHNGGEVDWGLPPGDEQILEPEAAVKMASLDALYDKLRPLLVPAGKRAAIYREVVVIENLKRRRRG